MRVASWVPSAAIAVGSDNSVSWRAAVLIAASWFNSLVERSLASTSRCRSAWMAMEQHGADRSDQEEAPRDRTGHVRAGQGDSEEGGQHDDEDDSRLPALTVEGDAGDRHEHQHSEPAVDASGRQHEKGHRRRVDRGADEKGARRHGVAVHDPGGKDDQQQGAHPEGPHVRRARRPGRAELARQRNRGKGHVGRVRAHEGRAAARSGIGREPPRPERFDLGFCPRVAAPVAARADGTRLPLPAEEEEPIMGGAAVFGRLSKWLNDPQGPVPRHRPLGGSRN